MKDAHTVVILLMFRHALILLEIACSGAELKQTQEKGCTWREAAFLNVDKWHGSDQRAAN